MRICLDFSYSLTSRVSIPALLDRSLRLELIIAHPAFSFFVLCLLIDVPEDTLFVVLCNANSFFLR